MAYHENEILEYATKSLNQIDKLRIIGQADHKTSLISFIINDFHPHDIGTILGDLGVAIRVGHHCSQPTMKRFGLIATARASFAIYNDKEDVDALVEGLKRAVKVLK
jgi:cysteine desulfurase/selenocysteine lyase